MEKNYCDDLPGFMEFYNGTEYPELGNQYDRWPYNFSFRRKLHSIFKGIVCDCNAQDILSRNASYYSTAVRYPATDTIVWYCGACNLVSKEQLHRCFNCKAVFIEDFTSPSYCTYKRVCLDCFLSLDMGVNCAHNTHYNVPEQLSTQYSKAEYVPPKFISDDEFDAFLNS